MVANCLLHLVAATDCGPQCTVHAEPFLQATGHSQYMQYGRCKGHYGQMVPAGSTGGPSQVPLCRVFEFCDPLSDSLPIKASTVVSLKAISNESDVIHVCARVFCNMIRKGTAPDVGCENLR